VKLTLTSVDDLSTRVEEARSEHDRQYPGDGTERQPVHTICVPADRFIVTTPEDLGAEAAGLMTEHVGDDATMVPAFGVDAGLAGLVRERMNAKLAHEPVEDLRVDFGDGYGERSDEEEDTDVDAVVEAVAVAYEDRRLPYYWGLRVKPFTDGCHRRAMRTLDGFLTGLAARLGKLPGGFLITFPAITSSEQVAVLADFCARLEEEMGLPAGKLRFEIQVETAECVINHFGEIGLRSILDAGAGRISGAHFGVRGFTTALGLPPAERRLDHPACDVARAIMQMTLAGSGVRLSDGAPGVEPADDTTAELHRVWGIHADLVRHSLAHGFYQGWDTHPAHLASRYAALFAFHLDGLDDALARLRAAGTDQGDTAALTAWIRRGVACGAVPEDDVRDVLG
jgi:hypothetical protein